MAGIIQIGGQTGLTAYGVVRNSAGSVWDGAVFSAFNASNWSSYVIAMTEQGSSGYYKANFPSAITVGKYSISIHTQSGGSPAATDEIIGFGSILWDGANEESTVGLTLKGMRVDQLFTATTAGVKPTIGSFFDKLFNKDGSQTFDPTTDSLEAQKDAGVGGLTPANIAAAVWDEVLSSTAHTTTDSAGERLRAVDDKLPSGSMSGFDPTTQKVNLNNDQSAVTIGTINNMSAAALALIKAQFVAGLSTDSMPELGSLPSSTPTIYQALMLLYMALRNKRTASGSQESIYNNAGTAITNAPISDDGTTFTKDKFV